MYGWKCLLAILPATAVCVTSDQQAFERHATAKVSNETNSTGNLIFHSLNTGWAAIISMVWPYPDMPHSSVLTRDRSAITATIDLPGTILYQSTVN